MIERLDISGSLQLRPLEEADAEELHRLIEENRAHLARWLPWAPTQTLADTHEFIRRSRLQQANNNGFQAAIVDDGEIAGVVGFHAIDWVNRSASLGYWLAQRDEGRGTMTAAVSKLVDHAISVWRLNRLEISAAVENLRSRAIPERLGFSREGVRRQAERVGDRYLDTVTYSMIASDWKSGQAEPGPGIDLLAHELRPARGAAAGALVLLHGRGTDQYDLLPLLDELDPERRLSALTPRAPLELSPGGFHWYVSRTVGHPDRDTFHAAYATLGRWLDALPGALGVPWSRTVLGGFSMGAVMSYALALGAGRPAPAGLIAFSGFLPTVEGFELDLGDRRGLPVAIGHGTADPVISVEFGRDARRLLQGAGANVLYRESPMGHGIDPAFARELQGWLRDVLGGQPPDQA